MIAFFPDGQVFIKQNLCSCNHCIIGNFNFCKIKKCKVMNDITVVITTAKIDNSKYEQNKISRNSFFLNLEEGAFIALYPPPQATELFYLCMVLTCETATESISNANDHSILKGMKDVKVNYLEKVKEKKGFAYYKLFTDKEKIVLAEQTFYLDVLASAELTLNIKDYQFLSDCIWFIIFSIFANSLLLADFMRSTAFIISVISVTWYSFSVTLTGT